MVQRRWFESEMGQLAAEKLCQPKSNGFSEAPSNFITGTALLFWCFGDFRCGVCLCFIILYRYKNRKKVKKDIQ